jgi:hypothetical protein
VSVVDASLLGFVPPLPMYGVKVGMVNVGRVGRLSVDDKPQYSNL